MNREKKFTPGPWKYLTGAEAVKVVRDATFGTVAWGCVEVSENRFIRTEGRSHLEAKANANLISAAPELLEALEEIVKSVNLNHSDRKIADKAIKKAYGEKS